MLPDCLTLSNLSPAKPNTALASVMEQLWSGNHWLGWDAFRSLASAHMSEIPSSGGMSINIHKATLWIFRDLPRMVLVSFRWYWILLPFFIWEVRRIAYCLWWKAPKNIKIIGCLTPLGKYLTAICMIFDSDRILEDAYNASQGRPFAIPMLDRYVIFFSDREVAERLERNTPVNLSEIEALHELASTDHVLRNVKISSKSYFKDGSGALRKHLRSNIPIMSRNIQERVKHAFDMEFNKAELYKQNEPIPGEKWKRITLVPMLLRMITRVNVPIFVGNEPETEEVFINLMSFFWSCLTTLILITFIPSFLIPWTVPILMGGGFSKWKLYDTILRLAKSAVDHEHQENGKPKPAHLVQWVTDMMAIPNAVEVAKTSLGLVFGSAFQIPMVTQSTIYYLCKFPSHLPSLLAEATENEFKPFTSTNQDMPYMDSFIKETARLSPGLILSVPRRVMSTYVSQDNIIVPEGNWLAIPQYTLMRDPNIWTGGAEFNGFRFVDKEGRSMSRFTHPSYDFPYWGSIRHACPARFYAASVVKTIVTRLLCHYEFKLEKPQTWLFFSFDIVTGNYNLSRLLMK